MIPYLALSAVHLALVAVDDSLATSVTKALLMPALALWVYRAGGPRLLLAALAFSWVGDVALEVDGLFVLGMAGFGAAHVCYVTWFVRQGALRGLRRRWWVPIAGLVAWSAAIGVLWGPLGEEEPALRIPIVVYSLLLTATAVTAFGISLAAGLGGALFLLSDTLIAMGLADVARPEPAGVWIMLTYLAGQLLLAVGIVRHDRPKGVRGQDAAPFSVREERSVG
ncbi:lysoplasmalogenase [Mumia sp.]|uniref:lysoplasmalogenase n=1 Tax=Mumia sp. TaxID=1965300 RepID=UPI002603F1DD|nr:lysoplasmalogenase [Mumia sp.]MDD9349504.1 lysoplasmalogenase [Mumia sp.]